MTAWGGTQGRNPHQSEKVSGWTLEVPQLALLNTAGYVQVTSCSQERQDVWNDLTWATNVHAMPDTAGSYMKVNNAFHSSRLSFDVHWPYTQQDPTQLIIRLPISDAEGRLLLAATLSQSVHIFKDGLWIIHICAGRRGQSMTLVTAQHITAVPAKSWDILHPLTRFQQHGQVQPNTCTAAAPSAEMGVASENNSS